MIRQIRIHGLRGFATAQTLNVAIPNGEIGSGLTILVGPNNGGKSTVVEALGALSKNRPQSFDIDKRNRVAGDRVTLSVMSSDDQTRQLQTIHVGGVKPATYQTWTLVEFLQCLLGAFSVPASVNRVSKGSNIFKTTIFLRFVERLLTILPAGCFGFNNTEQNSMMCSDG
jgi:ABC-type arginine transport system ATPase subunit